MKTIQCKDCNENFIMEDEELAWFDKKGFPHPKRCKDCRVKKRAQEHLERKA